MVNKVWMLGRISVHPERSRRVVGTIFIVGSESASFDSAQDERGLGAHDERGFVCKIEKRGR